MALPPQARAAGTEAVIIGDSIGVGIASATGLKSRARISFSLRRNDLAAMLAQVPKHAVVVLSAGLNDAGDPIEHIAPSVDRAITTAARSGRRIVWIGPPCVFGKLDERARTLDKHLAERLAGTGIEYVSLVDDWICRRENRTADGVHFHHAGYLYLWEKIRREAPAVAFIAVACAAQASRGGARSAGPQCADRK